MVFLTMYPETGEHTKEPAYDKDLELPPVFHLQSVSDLNGRSENPEIGSASSSLDGSQVEGSLSSKHTTPHSENGIALEVSAAQGTAEVKMIKSTIAQLERPISGEELSETVQTPSTRTSSLVDLKHPSPHTTSIEYLSSGDMIAESQSHVSEHQSFSSGMSLLGECSVW